MQAREKVEKSRSTVFFLCFVAQEDRKVGSLKRRARSNCTPSWREEHFEVNTWKAHHCGSCFGSWDVEKAHAVVPRSTFPSQNLQDTSASEQFWKFRCLNFPKWTPFWREAHFEVKSVKNWPSQTTFGSCDVEKVHAVVVRSIFPSQNVQNTPFSDHFWKLRCRKSACGSRVMHIAETMFGPLSDVQPHNYNNNYYYSYNYNYYSYKYHYATPHYHYNYNYHCNYHCHYTTPARHSALTLHGTVLHYATHSYNCTPLEYTPLEYHYTTTQGGGGSFKNRETYRKGWSTDGRANQLMDRKVAETLSLLSFSLFLSLSICLSVYLPTYLSIYLSTCVSIYLPIYLTIY